MDARSRTNTQPDGDTTRVKVPAWALGPGLMCRMCTQLTQRSIGLLPADYLELGRMLGKSGGSVDEQTGGTRELPVPIRLGVEALQSAILDETDRWATAVAESVGFWFYGTGPRPDRVRYACGWLVGLFDRLLLLPPMEQHRFDPTEQHMSGKDYTTTVVESGVDGAIRLLELHLRVEVAAGRVHKAHRLWTPCPGCQRLTLEHPEGANFVECRICGHRMPYERYEELAGVLARAHEGTRKGSAA